MNTNFLTIGIIFSFRETHIEILGYLFDAYID